MNVPLNINLQQILLHLFNFLLLFGGLYLLLYKPVKDFMDKRQSKIRQIIEESEKMHSEAEGKKAEYEAKIAGFDKYAAEKEKEVLKEADEKAEKKLSCARAEAEKIVEEARVSGRKEHDRIVESAGEDIASLAAEAAEKILSESMDSTYAAFLDAVSGGEISGKQG